MSSVHLITMKFKKGSEVEVFSQNDGPRGGWRCAEIISRIGKTYTVKYLTCGTVVEKVPKKVLRPCPPHVGAVNWASGDLAEVLHNCSWKVARVLKAVDKNYLLVRLIGSSIEITIHKYYLRLRQCWDDGQWFVMKKNADTPTGNIHLDSRTKVYACEDCSSFCQHQALQARSLKRRSPIFSYDFDEPRRKKRTFNKDDICSLQQYPSSEKVDVVVYPNDILDEYNIHSPDLFGREASRINDSSFVETTTSADTDSCASSVGSCSAIVNDDHYSSFRLLKPYDSVNADYTSDAESSSAQKFKERSHLSSNDGLGLEGKRSKLHAYYSTVRKLYDSGPLSWEDEVRLTNLRRVLNISDDEHLMLLKNLVSTC